MPDPVNYSEYLALEKILGAQFPISQQLQRPAHDEMLFIVIHQAYELWFKQLLFEVDAVAQTMNQPSLNHNSPELQTVVHRLSRCTCILKLLVQQVDIMETMSPMDFLDFRDMLRPASGFQSWQFKTLEAKLGLKYEQRFGQQYYTSQLQPKQVEIIKKAESEKSLLQMVNDWLERMPFFEEAENWKNFTPGTAGHPLPAFWEEYQNRYRESLADAEQANNTLFETFFLEGAVPPPLTEKRSLSVTANRSALFIMLYCGYPALQLPFRLLNELLEIDEQLSTWRYRHMSMVHRMIGTRIGTGGSTGRDYLKSALDKHYIFKEIAQLTSFLIERRKLPQLSPEMETRLGYIR